MRKKLYFVLCVATCFMFATACNKNNSEELTTSAYKDTVSDMEKTTKATEASSDASTSSEDNKKTTTAKKDDTTSSESTAESSTDSKATSSSSSSSSSSSTESNSTTATTSAETTTSDEDITAEGDENFEEPTTATKESEKESWASSGTLSGFVDSDSVEIIMEDGSTKTYFVYDEEIANQLEELLNSGEEQSIDFVSRPIAGQANSQIIEIK